MGLNDYLTPSVVAEELGLLARRAVKKSSDGQVSFLVVEGPTDSDLWGPLCARGEEQVFAAGTRGLVEQLLEHLGREPIDACNCAFLTDCDGLGKQQRLREANHLIVTECCDLEADLISIGAADRVLEDAVGSAEVARRMRERAVSVGVAVSRVRRAAARERVSMKKRGRRLTLLDMGWSTVCSAVDEGESSTLDLVSEALNWSETDVAYVKGTLSGIPEEFELVCNGKDVFDGLSAQLDEAGNNQFNGVSGLVKAVQRSVQLEDLIRWEVGRRLLAWQKGCAGNLLLSTGVPA